MTGSRRMEKPASKKGGTPRKSGNLYLWLAAVLAVVASSAATAVILVGKQSRPEASKQVQAPFAASSQTSSPSPSPTPHPELPWLRGGKHDIGLVDQLNRDGWAPRPPNGETAPKWLRGHRTILLRKEGGHLWLYRISLKVHKNRVPVFVVSCTTKVSSVKEITALVDSAGRWVITHLEGLDGRLFDLNGGRCQASPQK